jgi:DNA polymerase I-like protein with 3'-5' exonuclease and polymerase domains
LQVLSLLATRCESEITVRSKPALQCIPKEAVPLDEDDPQSTINIRDAFCAADRCTLVAADYSQIEMRVLAHLR